MAKERSVVLPSEENAQPEQDDLALLEQYHQTKQKEIRDQLIIGNLPLVRSIASEFVKKNPALSADDLIGEGCLGLMKAIDDYEPERKEAHAFSTIAYPYIRNSMLNYLRETERIIALPTLILTRLKRLRLVHNSLTEELSREPTKEEELERYNEEEKRLTTERLKAKLGRKPSKEELEKEVRPRLLTLDTLADTLLYDSRFTSFDQREESNEVYAPADLIPDDTPQPDEAYEKNLLSDSIEEVIDAFLTAREKDILLSRNLSPHPDLSLEQLGEKYHLSPQRISQIEAKAKQKIRDYYQRTKR